MKTRELIKCTALQLFNDSGLINITLRNVAEAMSKSYGNITYHFQTKEVLLRELYDDMTKELATLSSGLAVDENLLATILTLPFHTYEISVKYLFFFLDYSELRRNYPDFTQTVDVNMALRANQLKSLMHGLREQGFLPGDTDEETILYIMELSGAMRTFYFQKKRPETVDKKSYVLFINKLLFPYLSVKGKDVYKETHVKLQLE